LADRFSHGLRVYSAEGVFLKDIGGEGEGPGEYEHIRGMDRCNASPVVAFDLHWDMKIYDGQLQLVEERPPILPGIGGTPYDFDCGPSGHWVATGWGDVMAQIQSGYYVATAPIVLGIGDSVLVNFGEQLSSERFGTARDDGTPTGSGPHPFGRKTHVAIGPDKVFLGDASDYRIEAFDLHGNPLSSVEWTGPNREITSRHLEIYETTSLEGMSPGRAPAFRRWIRSLSELEQFPAYDDLRVDQDGRLWVRSFLRPGDSSRQWIIFGENGRRIGELTLPENTSLLDSGLDYVLVVEAGDLDVATVRLYRLVTS
jgi:hypothetical protein